MLQHVILLVDKTNAIRDKVVQNLLPLGIFYHLRSIFPERSSYLEIFHLEIALQNQHLNTLEQGYPHTYPQLVDNSCGFPNSNEVRYEPWDADLAPTTDFDRDNSHF